MSHHAAHLEQLVEAVGECSPWESFPQVSYLDAQAALLWMRLGVFTEALELLIQSNPLMPRWQIEDPVQREIRRVANAKRWLAESEIERLLDHPNVHLNEPAQRGSEFLQEVAKLRARIEAEELHTDPEATTHRKST